MSELRVIIAGGGTGGHIFPAVATGHALLRLHPDTRLLFVGAKGKMEMEKVPKEGFEIEGLDIAGFNRSNLLKNISLPWKLLKSRMQARSIIRRFRPSVVVGVGGYASFPVLNAAQGMGIPTVIQEQNSYAGKTNKILGRKAKAICVAYKGMEVFFPKDKLLFTGNPVRKNIADMKVSRQEGLAHFGLHAGLPVILVVGGSLGALSVNKAIAASLAEIVGNSTQMVWQTGRQFYSQAEAAAAAYAGRVKAVDFIDRMEFAYAAADIIISRAGALAVTELCIAAKPVIFVPFPYAAENHQESNAMALVSQGAAVMVKDSELATKLVEQLKKLVADEPLQQKMRTNLAAMAIRNADERIAEQIMMVAGVKS